MTMMFNIILKEEDDIEIQQTQCRSPSNCNCYVDSEAKCGYNRRLLQQKVVEHYLKRARAIHSMTNEQFMGTYGYYFDERD